ncbi:MAG: glucosaminidase domain-containing protein [Gammaproteobacteria bacterium]|nr:glucosaminidase domain-containing protein [Gammaproteobacteria bacterium]
MTASITDFSQYSELRTAAGDNDPAALREVAGQFEALFLQQMLKSMRDASLGDPLFGDSNAHETFQGMMDQQLAMDLAGGKGIGLADVLVRQLGGTEAAKSVGSPMSHEIPHRAAATSRTVEAGWSDPKAFVKDIWPHAERSARKLNVAPEAIVAQAALETGWGKHVMPDASGSSSFNLFGIKSSGAWGGDQVVRKTLEFENGVAQPQQAKFRSYANVASAFADYTDFISDNPRYGNVVNSGTDAAGFARALQDSGYATDPDYAQKIQNVLDSPTMRRVMSELQTGT